MSRPGRYPVPVVAGVTAGTVVGGYAVLEGDGLLDGRGCCAADRSGLGNEEGDGSCGGGVCRKGGTRLAVRGESGFEGGGLGCSGEAEGGLGGAESLAVEDDDAVLSVHGDVEKAVMVEVGGGEEGVGLRCPTVNAPLKWKLPAAVPSSTETPSGRVGQEVG